MLIGMMLLNSGMSADLLYHGMIHKWTLRKKSNFSSTCSSSENWMVHLSQPAWPVMRVIVAGSIISPYLRNCSVKDLADLGSVASRVLPVCCDSRSSGTRLGRTCRRLRTMRLRRCGWSQCVCHSRSTRPRARLKVIAKFDRFVWRRRYMDAASGCFSGKSDQHPYAQKKWFPDYRNSWKARTNGLCVAGCGAAGTA